MIAKRIFFHAESPFGLGHIRRATLLAQGMLDIGLRPEIIGSPPPTQGFPNLPDCPWHSLPAVRTHGETFTDLRTDNDQKVDETLWQKRRDLIEHLFYQRRPDLIVTDLFPFGRRAFSQELMALGALARKYDIPMICSLRDIIVSGTKTRYHAQSLERFALNYQTALVHGDPQFMRLEETAPWITPIASRLSYTGFISSPKPPDYPTGNDDLPFVLVSVGGGASGPRLLESLLIARAHPDMPDLPWRILIGPRMPQSQRQRLKAMAQKEITFIDDTDNLTAWMQRACFCLMQGGYNSIMELMNARKPALVIPYEGINRQETEQRLRAERLIPLGLHSLDEEKAAQGDLLASAIRKALDSPPIDASTLDRNGGQRSAEILKSILEKV